MFIYIYIIPYVVYNRECSIHFVERNIGRSTQKIKLRNCSYYFHDFSIYIMACNEDCFTILDSANTYHHLKIKEALHIMWEKPILNKQVQHFDVLLNY